MAAKVLTTKNQSRTKDRKPAALEKSIHAYAEKQNTVGGGRQATAKPRKNPGL